LIKFKKNSPYIIAEIGCNHNGSINLAKKLVDEAKKAGCDAVKFQLWEKDTAHTKTFINKLNKQKETIDGVKLQDKELNLKNVEEQLEAFAFGRKQHKIMKDYCDKIKIDFASTALTEEDVNFLVKLNVSFLKIASQDLNHTEFIKFIASKNMTTILSTGLGNLAEIEKAVNCFKPKYINNLTLLHCISLYPPKDNDIHLNQMNTLKHIFDLSVGYSDHSIGTVIPLAAVALGAKVIEKHFTLDKSMPGWDHYVSATPGELKEICDGSKRIVKSLGEKFHDLNEREIKKKDSFRRSIVTIKAMKKGEVITKEKIFFKRPGTGIKPDEINYVIGRTLKNDMKEDEIIKWNDLL
jgi:N-acetylneuraminate synthase